MEFPQNYLRCRQLATNALEFIGATLFAVFSPLTHFSKVKIMYMHCHRIADSAKSSEEKLSRQLHPGKS
jgi:hypothetical protein